MRDRTRHLATHATSERRQQHGSDVAVGVGRRTRSSRAPGSAPSAARIGSDPLHKAILDNIADGVYYVDRERRISYWNSAAEALTGYLADEVVGRLCHANILQHVDAAGRALCLDGCPLAATIEDGRTRETEVWYRHRDGSRRPVLVKTAPVVGSSGVIEGAVEIFSDAAPTVEARRLADQASQDAMTDALTGLANRRRFDAEVRARVESLRRYDWPFGLLIMDLDGFKEINDRLGHTAGDEVLRGVAATVVGATRLGDLAARWGGDEFAVIVQGVPDGALVTTAERLHALLGRAAIRANGEVIDVSASFGATLALATDSATSLIRRADSALYRAKQAGRDRIEVAPAAPART